MRAFLIGLLLCLGLGSVAAGESGVSEKKKHQLIEACAAAASSVYEPEWRHVGFEINPIDTATAIPTCETALAAAPCCIVVKAWLAHAYLARGEWGDREAALPLLESAAAAGNVLGMALLSEVLTDELATPRQIARAAVLARRAAEDGFVPGQYLLGKMLHNGTGMPVDDVEAGRWFELAAVGGFLQAKELLAGLYLHGLGRPQDEVQARRLYEQAADDGSVEAFAALGSMHEFGQGVPKSDVAAAVYYETAAAFGDAFAQNNLGYLYQHGLGVTRD